MNASINANEVQKVKSNTAHTIRKSIVSLTALAVLSLPLLASAGVHDPNRSLFVSGGEAGVQSDPVSVYGKLKAKSREVCGSSDLRITGGLRRSQQVDACYEDTLTAAVQRLNDPEVNELHYRS